MQRRIFITGTDTAVGKTVVTALLAARRDRAVALKPFCSGERSDAEVLAAITGRAVPAINPWFFEEPVSPWTAAKRSGVTVSLDEALAFVRKQREELVLIEGAGGVLTPLGERFTAADLIRELGCEIILVAPDRLGVLNQVCLAVRVLGGSPRIVLVKQGETDASTATNLEDLRELLPWCCISELRFLRGLRKEAAFFREAAGKMKDELDKWLA